MGQMGKQKEEKKKKIRELIQQLMFLCVVYQDVGS